MAIFINGSGTSVSIDELKRQWMADPCWDIETTPGFEEHWQELYIFRLETENRQMADRLRQINELKGLVRAFLGL